MSKKILKNALMPLLLGSMILGMDMPYVNEKGDEDVVKAKPLVRGYEHTGKTEEEIQLHKKHQKKIKAKRKAKKGIYEHKIIYKKAKNKK